MSSEPSQPRRIGRYLLFGPIASGGMASVHLGRLAGEAGFSRTVAIKRLHPQLAEAPEIAEGLREEARIVARIQHPNVVPTLDLLVAEEEAFLVMDYVRGESLARLLRAARARSEPVPAPIVASLVCGALHGLHAAHEACSESGEPLGIVHRDISPENVLVGVDGTARLLDFGIAKARGRLSTTRGGQLKGKLAYMAPEQVLCGDVTRRTDVFAAGVVLWEALAGQRLFDGGDEGALIGAVLEKPIPPPSALAAHVPRALDAIVLRALERNAAGRYATARELAIAIEEAAPLASPRAVGEWVEELAADALARRAACVAEIESASAAGPSSSGGLSVALSPRDGAPRDGGDGAGAAKRARPRLALLAVALLGSAAALAAPWLRRGPSGPEGPPAQENAAGAARAIATQPEAPEEPSAPPAAPAPSPSSSPPPSSPPPSSPGRVSLPPPAPSTAASAPAQHPARAAARAPAPAPPAARAQRCSPPYTVDKTGIRRLKPQCL
jgi:serine/threonine-protein kinase